MVSFNFDNGYQPYTGLTRGSDGNFYGTTLEGGQRDAGTLFKITPAGALTTLVSFTGTNGDYPRAGLLQGPDGYLYGVACEGGTNGGYGTAFKMNTSGSFAWIYSFSGSNGGGKYPNPGLALGPDGNFYSTTQQGGASNHGAIYKITPAGAVTTLASFSGTNGSGPIAGLTLGSDGSYYGVTQYGGSGTYGAAFKVTSSGSLTMLASLTPASGANPIEGLIQGSDGNFYGSAPAGGAAGTGDVFQLTPSGSVQAFYSPPASGSNIHPYAQLAIGIDGNYYGTSYDGGTGYGTIFSVTPSGTGTVVATFNGTNGANPYSWLLRSQDGNSFYGTTLAGGSAGLNGGSVYQFFPSNVVAAVGQPFTYPVYATSVAPVSYSATGLPPGITVNASTGVVSGTATAAGAYTGTVSAINAGGTGTTNLNITAVSGAPVFTSNSTAQAGVGVPFSFQAAASNLPTSYSATNLPATLQINPTTGLIIGTPGTPAFYIVSVKATNAAGTTTKVLTISVVPPPAITSSLSDSGTMNSAYSYQIAASNNPMGYGASGLPAGLTVDPAGGMISGTPTVEGTYAVLLSATNAAGTGTAMFSLVLQSGSPQVPALPSAALAALALLLIGAAAAALARMGQRGRMGRTGRISR